MNIFKLLSKGPAVVSAAQDLAKRIGDLHSNPRFQALINSDPSIRLESEAISRDARTIQEALR